MTNKDTEQKLNQLQLLEQNMQQFLMQKQQFQAQLAEVESAIKGLKTSKDCYKIVGNIMVSSGKGELQKDLESKKSTVELRIKTLEKQEANLKKKAEELQKEVLEGMKENDKSKTKK